MQVIIPTQLRSYTRSSEVQANGETLKDLLADLDRQFPGIRFRMINEQDAIREHIKIFVNQETAEHIDHLLQPGDVVRIIGALSGG
jgi:molybdopterin converting factor small subunit